MTEPKKEKKKLHKFVILIPTIVFLVFIYFVMIRSFPGEVKDAIAETDISLSGFGNLSNTFEGVLEDNISGKYNYINLNGLTTKVLGIHSLNERQRLANGHLSYLGEEDTEGAIESGTTEDIIPNAENVIALNEFLSDRGIDFVSLLAPDKLAFYDVEFAPGYASDKKIGYSTMLEALNDAGVTTIDMETWFEDNEWTMDDVYFRTDHHWRPQAGLAAAGATMELLTKQGIVDSYDADLLSEDNYTIDTLEEWFLGSHGKRVGVYYDGIDDIDVYYPKFATDYIYSYLPIGTTDWNYSTSLLNTDYINTKNLFEDNTYNIYLYGSYPLQVVKNAEAKSDKRVLIVGDSYRQVYQYFLATQFQEIDYIDLRYYTDGTFTQYVEDIQPDLVIMCTTHIMDSEFYDFGTEEYLAALDVTSTKKDSLILGDVKIEAQEDNNANCAILCDGLEPDQTYTLTVDSTIYSEGEGQYVQMTLQDLSMDTAVYNCYFNANSDDVQKWIFTVPEDADDYAICFYAGTKGHTANASAEATNIQIRKGIFED